MKKYILTIILGLWILVSCCGMQAAQPEPKEVLCLPAEITPGLTTEQLMEQLSALELGIEMPDYTEFPLPEDIPEAVEDGRTYNLTDLSFYYTVKNYDLSFTFSYEGILQSMASSDPGVKTPPGLAAGISLDDARALLGEPYAENCEDYVVIQYKTGDHYFNIFHDGATVSSWSLQAHSNINND